MCYASGLRCQEYYCYTPQQSFKPVALIPFHYIGDCYPCTYYGIIDEIKVFHNLGKPGHTTIMLIVIATSTLNRATAPKIISVVCIWDVSELSSNAITPIVDEVEEILIIRLQHAQSVL